MTASYWSELANPERPSEATHIRNQTRRLQDTQAVTTAVSSYGPWAMADDAAEGEGGGTISDEPESSRTAKSDHFLCGQDSDGGDGGN